MRLKELIFELERAEKGSGELSDEMLLACGWKHLPDGWMHNSDRTRRYSYKERPDPTRSLDDAVALIPEECAVELHWKAFGHPKDRGPEAFSVLYGESYETRRCHARKPALALCIAVLKFLDSPSDPE